MDRKYFYDTGSKWQEVKVSHANAQKRSLQVSVTSVKQVLDESAEGTHKLFTGLIVRMKNSSTNSVFSFMPMF